MPIAFDATRLLLGPLSPTPRGIDRVDLAYARHFFEESGEECCAVLPTAWGIRTFPRERVLRGLARLEELWAEERPHEDDLAWSRLKLRLQGNAVAQPPRPPGGPIGLARRMASLLHATGIGLGESAASSLKPGTIYLNTGQIGLAFPPLLRWLERRPDLRPIFMLHDVIPLETPQYVSAVAAKRHAAMIDQTARHAAGLIVTTGTARTAIEAELRRRMAPALPTVALHLPVAAAFRQPAPPEPELLDARYFVVCGAIEPRKNHALLLNVWKRLHRELGAATPQLVVAGSPGWRGRRISGSLQRSGEVSKHIHVVSGVSTPALKRLICGARALLMPSFIEGFGLPVAEAGALGIPVIASDIPAHREVADPATTFLDPADPTAWTAAVLRMAKAPRSAGVRLGKTPSYGWNDYFRALSDFMRSVEARTRR